MDQEQAIINCKRWIREGAHAIDQRAMNRYEQQEHNADSQY